MNATVIVATHRGGTRIKALLDSLRAQTAPHQVIVVDNASTDGTAEILAGYPEVTVMRMEQNAGFSRAVNVAAKRADGEALVLLNDDCTCGRDFVENITRRLDPSRGIVMTAGVLRDQHDEGLVDTAGMELDASLLVFDYLNGMPVSAVDDSTEDPIGPCGAAAGFDRAAFLAVGGFDENLFAYWEDVDLVLRLRSEGGRCALCPDAQGVHHHSATLGSGSKAKNRLTGFGRGYVLRKWGGLSLRRAPRVLATDGTICLGQAVLDRNVTGLTARWRGWQAAAVRLPYPADAVTSSRHTSALETLRRRLMRRARLRRAAA